MPDEEYANRYYFYHYDIRGSVTNIVGDDGNLVKGYEYDEYGNTTDGGEAGFINEVTFTGSVRDLGSGLQYMNARYYDPATGRFVSQDTYTGTPYAHGRSIFTATAGTTLLIWWTQQGICR